MSPVLLGGVIVILLLIIAVVTMGMTRWGRSELDQPVEGEPRDKGRVSGGEDD
ncbi:hypothetical protein [Edaphobacter aggregans]|uniref:hypothetical protein n=1 Tax=Edaphobacter aggregans TaxID=570835 RepID=UPI0012F864EA|nr:hypothetical protein [Edaphobacter aggregans]